MELRALCSLFDAWRPMLYRRHSWGLGARILGSNGHTYFLPLRDEHLLGRAVRMLDSGNTFNSITSKYTSRVT